MLLIECLYDKLKLKLGITGPHLRRGLRLTTSEGIIGGPPYEEVICGCFFDIFVSQRIPCIVRPFSLVKQLLAQATKRAPFLPSNFVAKILGF